MDRKFFTVRQAEEMLPTLEFQIKKIIQIKTELNSLIKEIESQDIKVKELFLSSDLSDKKILILKEKIERLSMAMAVGIEDVQRKGCLVKDLDLGLVDFYSILGGQEVFLCWQLGEDKIEHWHSINEGFSKRKPIDQNHLLEKLLH